MNSKFSINPIDFTTLQSSNQEGGRKLFYDKWSWWHDASSINKGSCMAAYCFSIFTFANFPDYNQIHIHSLVLTHFDSLKLFIITFVKSSILFPNLVLKVTCRVKANMPWTSKNGSSCHCYNKTFKTNFLQNDKR